MAAPVCRGNLATAGGCVVTLASGHPWDIAVDETYVYWTDNQDGAVVRVPKAGGRPTTLASGQTGAWGIAVDQASVYWTRAISPAPAPSGTVMKIAKGGGDPVTLASGPGAQWIAVDSTSVYWTTVCPVLPASRGPCDDVMKVELAGGAPVTLAAAQSPEHLVARATTLYWPNGPSTGFSDQGAIIALPIAGGTVSTLAATQDDPIAIAVDSTNVYWATRVSGWAGSAPMPTYSTIASAPLGGGTPTTVFAGQSQPQDIAVDSMNIYWTDQLAGAVMSVSLGGGAPTTLASGQMAPWSIAVDDTSVYWSNLGTAASGTLMKLTPK